MERFPSISRMISKRRKSKPNSVWESGRRDRITWRVDAVAAQIDGHQGHLGIQRKSFPLPPHARLGYHRLLLKAGPLSAECLLILCPDRAYQPTLLERGHKSAGIAVSVYGLRSERNWGCGDFTDLQQFCDWAVESTGASFVALNPLHSIPNRQPYNTSPYLPNCSFYRNPLYLDVESIEDVQASADARALLGRRRFRRSCSNCAMPSTWSTKKFCVEAACTEARFRRVPTPSKVAGIPGDIDAKATCSTVTPSIARSTSIFMSAIPMSGSGRTGRRSTATRSLPKWRCFAMSRPTGSFFTSGCSGR